MSNSTPRPSGKTMSSRLMTMKFMQRAAASTTPSTPQLSSQNAETPSSKRQKTSHTPDSGTKPTSDLELIQATIGEEDEKRERAIEKLAAQAGETKWVLSTADMEKGEEGKTGVRIEVAGYSDIDQDAWRPALVGRRSFGKFNRELERHQKDAADDSSSSGAETSSSSKEDDEDDENGENGENSNDSAGTRDLTQTSKEDALRRSNAQHLERRRQRKAEKAEMARLAERRRKKEVKLNRLASISGGGGSNHKPNGGNSDKVCFKCGVKGHEKRDCPEKGQRRDRDNAGNLSERSKPSMNH